MASTPEKQTVLDHIQSLWEDAAATGGDTPASDQPHQIMAQIRQLMNEAEETRHDSNDNIDHIGSMVMAAASTAPVAENESFDDIRSRMEVVSRLQPPHSDYGIPAYPASPEYAFGVAFSNVIRHAVRQYIETDLEPVLRNTIRIEIEKHLGAADTAHTTVSGGSGR